MIPSTILVLGLLVHYLADFTLQTDEQAKGKSTSIIMLTCHVGTYSLMWLLAAYSIYCDAGKALIFAFLTFISHFITDYLTSRIGKLFWDKQDIHNGFSVVGFDQVIHYITLGLTYKFVLTLYN